MITPMINLDDRRFDDLVEEAKARLSRGLPELTQIVPGDPVHALVDLFAWMTETVLYRANLIPERQRQAFLNLLQLPRRPATAARGVICIDSIAAHLPALLKPETTLRAAKTVFSTLGDLQPTPLTLSAVVKWQISGEQLGELGLTEADLLAAYPIAVAQSTTSSDGTRQPAAVPFLPTPWLPSDGPVELSKTLDGYLYLALSLHKQVRLTSGVQSKVVEYLAGRTLNVAVAPADAEAGQSETETRPRRLLWELFWRGADGEIAYLPVEQLSDSSSGCRKAGVARLRLPRDPSLLAPHLPEDPGHAGLGASPPAHPATIADERMLFWLRLSCPEEPDLWLGYIGINGVEVVGQGIARDVLLGVGDGHPNQALPLPHADAESDGFELQVETVGEFETWKRVDYLSGASSNEKVFVLDAAAQRVTFGIDARPPMGKRVRAAYYRYGGGSGGNLPAGSIKTLEVASPGLQLRHEWPTVGGIDAESVHEAERRIPAFLTHRNRAVTAEDFATLCQHNPINAVGRAHTIPRFLPGSSLATVRREVPGVVSVFVMPPREPALAAAPRPSTGLLTDVYGYLSSRTLLGTELYVLSPQFVPMAISVVVHEVDSRQRQTVMQAVERALLLYLWALAPGGAQGHGWTFGRSVEVDELRTVAGRVTGVRSVGVLHLYFELLGAERWERLGPGESLALEDYQLPELITIRAEPGREGEPPAPPPGIGLDEPPQGGSEPVPAPVVPDFC